MKPRLGSLVLAAGAAALALALAVTACDRAPKPSAEPLKVAAASDLAIAFKDVGAAFEAKTGKKVVFSFGSTGLLARQIAEGAPFDVFAAANVSFADDVVKRGSCLADSKALYARGRIVLWARQGGHAPKRLEDLKDPRYAKIAIANPEHAPYGRAAKQALIKAGVWDEVSSRIVYGENIQQTLQYAQSGNAEAAIIALSLAISAGGTSADIDDGLHDPIDQALVVCKGGGGKADRIEAARSFASFVNSDEGRRIMRRHGFRLPGEPSASADVPARGRAAGTGP
jgi:molybdate transport system substrate-binding protein